MISLLVAMTILLTYLVLRSDSDNYNKLHMPNPAT